MKIRELVAGEVPKPDGVTLTWLGQAGFVLQHKTTTVVIDPYLSNSLADKYRGTVYPHVRMAQPPLAAADLSQADLVLCTHRHTDHMDEATLTAIAEASDCLFVVPMASIGRLVAWGIPAHRVIGADDGVALHVREVAIDTVLAAHEEIDRDANGHSIYLGYVIHLGGLSIYHSGDCVPYEGQPETLRNIGVDIALLPVNGRDAVRTANGVPGNFYPDEAAALALAVNARLLVAHHFGMFDFNTVDQPALDRAITALARRVDFVQPTVGSSYEVNDHE